MKNLTQQIHLRNILTCIEDIENYCADLDPDQLLDDDLRIPVYRNLTMVGIEADNLLSNRNAVRTLKSFKSADFIEGLGMDTYAITHFINNDLAGIKKTILRMSAESKTRKRAKPTPGNVLIRITA